MSKKIYEVVAEGWPDGTYRRAGERFEMEQEAAKYLVLNGQIREAAPAVKPDKTKSEKTKSKES